MLDNLWSSCYIGCNNWLLHLQCNLGFVQVVLCLSLRDKPVSSTKKEEAGYPYTSMHKLNPKGYPYSYL
jgi:hypothetical protein